MTDTPLRPRRYDLIVFDWDGTLFDSTALIVRCIQAAARDLGVGEPAPEQAAYVIGLGLQDALQYAVPGLPEEAYPTLVRRYRHHYFKEQHEVTLFEGVRPLLDALRQRHHWVAVATGKSRQGLNAALESSGLGPLFDATRTADETASKPDPLMLHELMREFGVEPERTLMIGDTTHDLQLARNAGTDAIAVTYGAHDHSRLREFGPLLVSDSVPQLHDWLARHA